MQFPSKEKNKNSWKENYWSNWNVQHGIDMLKLELPFVKVPYKLKSYVTTVVN